MVSQKTRCNVLVKTCDRTNVRICIRTFELKIQIIKHSRRPGITQKYCFQRPRSRNKSVFHDVYIRLKGTELSFPWRIYTSRGSSDWIVVGAYYGRIIITPGLKGLLKALVHRRFFNQGVAFTLLFLFIFCFVVFLEKIHSISHKLNT